MNFARFGRVLRNGAQCDSSVAFFSTELSLCFSYFGLPVVFVTAYDEFALRAFEINAVDYLLSQIEQKLDPENFMRIHRSTIVNVNHIKSLHPLFNGDHLIVLHNGRELNLSRTYHEKMM